MIRFPASSSHYCSTTFSCSPSSHRTTNEYSAVVSRCCEAYSSHSGESGHSCGKGG
ncbi:hypothetical protein BV20DRAFT_316981 [Pilatotrama ljubarskyi]|nr:hypothetical protein BV20DRAFT_316981 [Pilatotrama ljubarskyi]